MNDLGILYVSLHGRLLNMMNKSLQQTSFWLVLVFSLLGGWIDGQFYIERGLEDSGDFPSMRVFFVEVFLYNLLESMHTVLFWCSTRSSVCIITGLVERDNFFGGIFLENILLLNLPQSFVLPISPFSCFFLFVGLPPISM